MLISSLKNKILIKNKTIFSFSQINKINESNIYDVVISGAGVVGLTLACALQKSQVFRKNKIILVDISNEYEKISQQIEKQNNIADHRVVTLSPYSKKFLQSIDIWEKIDQNRVTPFQFMQVYDAVTSNYLRIDSENSQNQEKNLGQTIEINQITAAGFKTLLEKQQIEIAIPNSIKQLKLNQLNNFMEIQLNDGRTIYTKLVVGCEGRNSFVKKSQKIPTYGWSYNQMGIVCTVKANFEHSHKTAWQRFLNNQGILALLPLWKDYYSIVWSANIDQYDYLIKLSDEQFVLELNRQMNTPSRLQTPSLNILSDPKQEFQMPPIITKVCNKRIMFPLASLQSQRYIQERIALIGDAAHSIHPMAGQGLNLGLADSAHLANQIIKNIKIGNDFGLEMNLEEYETMAKINNYTIAMGQEFIRWSYQQQGNNLISNIFNVVKGQTINILNNVPLIRNQIRNIAEGQQFQPSQFEWVEKK